MENPFGTAAGAKQEENQGFKELPLDVWFLARTSDRGGAAPFIKDTNEGVPFMFKSGMYCVGGDDKQVKANMFGSYCFFQAFIRPSYKDQGGPQSQEDYDTLSGRMTGIMNACLSPGIEGSEARWANTMAQLSAYAAELANSTDPEIRTTAEMFDVPNSDGLRDNAAYMATVFALLLRTSPRQVIVNLKIDKGKNGDRNDTVVGSFKDAIEANAKTKAKVAIVPFESKEGETFGLYATAEADGEGDPTDF
jgi:hypothetical protein